MMTRIQTKRQRKGKPPEEANLICSSAYPPWNARVLLSVGAITTFINSPEKEFETNPAYSLSKLHSTSNRAWQTEGQQVRTEHDGLTAQLGGHWVGLKHPLQWFVLQDAQGR